MNIVILGAPASGKGTYSDYLKKKYNFVHISMGDLLRSAVANGSVYSKEISTAIENGQIVEEHITAEILREFLEKNNLYNQILLDGYPRAILSVQLMEKFLEIDAVIKLEVSENILINRVLNRLRCVQCGKNFNKQVYNLSYCDDCGGNLTKRLDDTAETLKKRIDVYNACTVPVLDYYASQNKLYTLDADCTIEQGQDRIDKLMTQITKENQKVS